MGKKGRRWGRKKGDHKVREKRKVRKLVEDWEGGSFGILLLSGRSFEKKAMKRGKKGRS